LRDDPRVGPGATRIVEGGLDDPRVQDLLRLHLSQAEAASGPGSCHALDISALKSPDIRFWTIWQGDALLGCGALKRLSADHGEVKSMHAIATTRRQGAGGAILGRIIDTARAAGLSRLSLETGVSDYFAPARAFYRRHGFVECPPFGDYRPDPNSVFMTLDLGGD
jgi:putative acetyltransferase